MKVFSEAMVQILNTLTSNNSIDFKQLFYEISELSGFGTEE